MAINRLFKIASIKKHRVKIVSSLVFLMTITTLSESFGNEEIVDIVKDGHVNAALILPEDAYDVQQLAAEELQYHVQKMSGVQLDIYDEEEAAKAKSLFQIHFGKTKLAESEGMYEKDLPTNSYRLYPTKNALFISGKDTEGDSLNSMTGSGTLFAVYDLLEEQLNIKWLWPGELGTVIPQSSHITFNVDSNKNRIYKTAKDFSLWRAPYASGSPDASLKNWQSKESGEMYYKEQAKWLRRHRFGIGTKTRLVGSDTRVFHSFLNYWKEYGEEHPEYFNLLPDGTRREHPGRKRGGPGTTLCISNPDLRKLIVDNWRNSWRSRSKAHILLGENDSPALCTCDVCRSWDAPDPRFETSEYWGKGKIFPERSPFQIPSVIGNSVKWGWHGKLDPDPAPSLSDRYARFYLEIQKEAQKTHPDAVVAGFAYLNYWQAPKNPIKLNDKIVISFVPPTRFPYTSELSAEIRENWDGWRKTGAQVYLRPNFPAAHNAPMSFMPRLAQDLKYFSETGLIGSDYDSLNRGHFGTQGPSLYSVARMNTHPDVSVNEMQAEYYAAFGNAAPQIKSYFEFWNEISQKEIDVEAQTDMIGVVGDNEAQGSVLDGVAAWVKLYHFTFTPEVIKQGRHLINQTQVVDFDDETVYARIQYLDQAFHEVELTAQAIDTFVSFHESGQKDMRLKAKFKQQYADLLRYRAKLESLFTGDYGARQRAENTAFKSIIE